MSLPEMEAAQTHSPNGRDGDPEGAAAKVSGLAKPKKPPMAKELVGAEDK